MNDIGLIIYIIIIIVGILNSFLKKKNDANKPKPQPRNKRPNARPLPQEQQDSFGEELRKILSTFSDEEEVEEKKREIYQPQKKEFDLNKSQRQRLKEEKEEEVDVFKRDKLSEIFETELKDDQREEDVESFETSVKINIEDEDWQKALILSEIFNEPRFKKY